MADCFTSCSTCLFDGASLTWCCDCQVMVSKQFQENCWRDFFLTVVDFLKHELTYAKVKMIWDLTQNKNGVTCGVLVSDFPQVKMVLNLWRDVLIAYKMTPKLFLVIINVFSFKE